MYPITCPGGYPVPTVQGKFDLIGFCVTVQDPTAASEFAIVDDPEIKAHWSTGRLLDTLTNQKSIICHLKGIAGVDSVLSYEFGESIKTRHGISIYSTNTLAGSVCVYRR